MRILTELVKNIFVQRDAMRVYEPGVDTKKVLNVGGGSKSTPIPSYYSSWEHHLLDIDPKGRPDLVCDARELTTLPGGGYDAIYCSHNLEHYYRHHAASVVSGFSHMLNANGFAEVRVPDIAAVIKAVLEQGLELDDVLYQSAAGPISAHDVLYGYQVEIVESGKDYYAHKTGFTPNSLIRLLREGGFQHVFLHSDEYLGIHAMAFKTAPTSEQRALLEPAWNLSID